MVQALPSRPWHQEGGRLDSRPLVGLFARQSNLYAWAGVTFLGTSKGSRCDAGAAPATVTGYDGGIVATGEKEDRRSGRLAGKAPP